MTTLIVCLFIACLFPLLSKMVVAMAMKNQPEGYDNHYPRAQQASLTGFGARATAAHQNSFESLIVFATAALTALASQHVTHAIEILAIVYVVSRIIYHVVYLLNWAGLRSLIWAVGFFASLSILWLCIP